MPLLWSNPAHARSALAAERPEPTFVLDEIARLGYEGCQLGPDWPSGAGLREALAERGLRLAEVYAALPCSPDGPAPDALEIGRGRLAELVAAGGDVLVAALDGTPAASAVAGRVGPDTPGRLSDAGWRALAGLLDRLAEETRQAGARLAFHAHAGTLVETPAELDRLCAETDPGAVDVCLDFGHCIVGGGDPVMTLRRYGPRVVHVHCKDVDGSVLERLRAGEIPDLGAAVDERIFTELGSGTLDLEGCLHALADAGYGGWLMVEQDSSWLSASESGAAGRHVLDYALGRLIASPLPSSRSVEAG